MASYKNFDDKSLVILLKQGNEQAFAEIYHRYKAKLITSSLRLLKDPELVEELLQNLFLRIWERRDSIDPEQSLQAYLYRIAHNLAFDTFRRASREKELFRKLLVATPFSYEHIEQSIYSKENLHELQEAIQQLPPQQQKVVILCKLEGKSYEEAGEILNISTGTVNNHMHRAGIFLKEYFTRKSAAKIVMNVVVYALADTFK